MLQKINDSYNQVFQDKAVNKENEDDKSCSPKRTHLNWFTSNKSIQLSLVDKIDDITAHT